MHPHMPPDDYQRLRELAKLQALELRQQAIREAPAWLACAVVRAVRRMAGLLRFGRPQAVPSRSSTLHPPTPCQPSF
ncbi:hypothetical protein [Acidovorax sp. FJL06]|uniref:hypothetical protein n=1 Tax=Acidovorax sp. FJL06 TaxID=2153365 RepID=UPI000F559E25|nr:hypothetical protein [Acidovorax sp. FJL06]RQO80962.1 hypothetical protein DBV10_16090 [Acidovorax sp. FJL06]